MAWVLDQSDDGTFQPLSLEDRAMYRSNHRVITGGDPPEGREPSPDQLAALVTKLSRDEAPYVDFAVFTPHGRRQYRLHKFNAEVFVDGQLVKRELKGPMDFRSWKACWSTFRAAMISIRAATPATLDAYERGMEELHHLAPNHWGILFVTRSRSPVRQGPGAQDGTNIPADINAAEGMYM